VFKRYISALVLILMLTHGAYASEPFKGTSPLQKARDAFQELHTYTAIINSYTGGKERIRYFYKKPGFIRMEFISPHKGALLLYNPKTEKVRLRPFGRIKPLILTVKPENRLIISPRGHRVDESHIGALINNAFELLNIGQMRVKGRELVKGREAIVVEVTAHEGFESQGINRHILWLDTVHHLPVRAEGYNAEGELLEGVYMDELIPGATISNELFYK
jgi:outer membrane lipoprotein-sorting protein